MTHRLGLYCALALTTSPLAAAEWQQPVVAEEHGEFELDRILPDGDGYVMAGSGTWARVDREGRVELADAKLRPTTFDWRAEFAPLAPDRFLVFDATPGLVEIVDGHGARLAASAGVPDSYSFAPEFDGSDGLWVAKLNVSSGGPGWGRMQADGRVRSVPLPADATSPWNGAAYFAPLHDAPAAYALYLAATRLHLALVDYRGVAWTLAPPAADIWFRDVVRLAGGDVLVIGKQGEARGILWLGRYGRDGTLRWQRSYPDLVPGIFHFAALRLSGERVVLAAPDNFDGAAQGRWLAAFDAQGALLWRRDLIGETFHGYVDNLPGEAEPAFAYWSSLVQPEPDTLLATALVHVDADGRTLARLGGQGPAAVLRDGSLVEALHPPFPVSAPYDDEVRHHLRDGRQLAGPSLDGLVPLARTPLRGHVLENGDSVALSRQPDGLVQLRLFDAHGELRWRRTLEQGFDHYSAYSSDFLLDRNARLVSGPDRVCVGPSYGHYEFMGLYGWLSGGDVQCLRRSDGTLLLRGPRQPSVSPKPYVPLPGYALLGDGRVVLVETSDTEVLRTTLSGDGSLVQRQALPTPFLPNRRGVADGKHAVAAFRAGQALAVFVADPANDRFAVVSTALEGEAAEATEHAADYGVLLRVEPLEQGDWLLLSQRDSDYLLSRLGPDGSHRWSHPLAVQNDGSGLTHAGLQPAEFVAAAGKVVVATHAPQQPDGRTQVTLAALDAASGATLWRQAQTLLPGRGVRALAIDAARGLALATRDTADRPVLTAYALADGSERGKRALDCAAAPGCLVQDVALAADGSLRSFGAGFDATRLELDDTLQPAPLGQQALLGTWYAPGTNGQGLLIDYSATSGDLLAGWFTYDGDGVYDARGLRWYTLGGLVTPNAASAELDLYKNASGQFAAGPRTAAERIGRARLRLHACNELLLSYRFDSGEHAGLEGEVSMTRLTPALFPCSEADGRLQLPPLDAVAPQDGLSPAQSGAWYTAEQSGQGLLFDLRPPSTERAGHLVGGWFTYDPAGQADDAAAQHWFLLDGDLAPGAAAGRFTVPIYRSVGGRFDLRPTRTVHRVGEAELHFDGCAAATLDYRFDDSDLAAEFAGRQGRLALQRLLPCPD